MDFTLRPWTLNDLDSLVENANDASIAQFMTNSFPHPYTIENGKVFIDFATKQKPTLIFAIEAEGKAVGGIGIHPQTDIMQKNAELGYWLGSAYHGKGIVTRAVQQIIPYAFNNLDLVRLYARPFGNNLASQRVLEKAGFKLEARIEKNIYKNGEFLDECIYGIRKTAI